MLVTPPSIGITASVPQVSLKDVSPVRVLAIVQYAHKILGNSSGHGPFASSNQTLMVFSSAWFITSVYPLACGCPRDKNQFLIPNPKQKFLKSQLSNYHPLSNMIILGIPNLQTMFFHMKFWIFASVIVSSASISTHFVKQSIATSKNFTCLLPWGSGPTMSIPHQVNGHEEVMGLNFSPMMC